jgi:hypothetical protein
MKKHIIATLIGLVACGLLYLVGVFITWDFNPKNWMEEGRVIIGFFSLGVIALASSVAHVEYD